MVQGDDDDVPPSIHHMSDIQTTHTPTTRTYSNQAETAVSPGAISDGPSMSIPPKRQSTHGSVHGTYHLPHMTSTRLYRSPANPSVSGSPQVFAIPRHPSAIFSFPTPTTYAAPPDPTATLAPVAQGSASELFMCLVKKPEVVELEINGVSIFRPSA